MDLEADINNLDIDVDISGGLNVETSMSSAMDISSSNVGGPKGDKGEQGIQGVKGDPGIRGERGETGAPGPANTLMIGDVVTGDSAAATITGDAPSQVLNLVLPKGDKGDTGEQGVAGPPGPQGVQGKQGEQGVRGPQGTQGPAGKDFSITKTYASIAAMEADAVNINEGDFVMITSSVEDPDNAKLYVKGESDFVYLSDLSGAQGMKGEQGEQGVQGPQGQQGKQGIQGVQGVQGVQGIPGEAATITVGTVTTLPAGSDATVSNSGSSSEAVFNFGIPKGVDGVQPALQGMSWGTYHDRI